MGLLLCEIWENILSILSAKDLKSLSLVSLFFRGIARRLLWNKPKFVAYIGFKALRKIGMFNAPIHTMHLGQFILNVQCNIWFGVEDDKLRAVVDLLISKFQLTSFHIGSEYEFCEYRQSPLLPKLRADQISWLMQVLPVTKLDTRCFSLKNTMNEIVSCLAEAEDCPDIYLHEQNHPQLRLEHWTTLGKLPIAHIYGKDHSSDRDSLIEYDNLVGRITPAPEYFIFCGKYSPEDLRILQRTRISELSLSALDPSYSIKDFMLALDANQQKPKLNYDRFDMKLTPQDLQLLFDKYPVGDSIDDRCLDLYGMKIDEFTHVIMGQHMRQPFKVFNISSGRIGFFQRIHFMAFESIGLLVIDV